VKDLYTDIIIFGALASGALFNYIGLNVFLGSLVFGLAVPAGPPLASAVVEKIECIVTGVLVPLFMAMCTMGADLLKIDFDDYILKSTAIVVFVVILAKFGAYLVPLLYFKLPKQDALALAFLISTKGIVELGSFTYMRELGVC
jgi:Kef-type K+ transport system membrane component KefB